MSQYVLVLLGLAALANPPLASAGAMHAAPVRAEPVKVEEVNEHRRVTGSLRAMKRSVITAREEGRILEVAKREGEAVKKGEVLATMDARRVEAQLAEVRADLEVAQAAHQASRAGIEEEKAAILEAEANLENEKREYRRVVELRGTNAISEQEIDLQESKVHIAQARVEMAKAALETAKANEVRAEKAIAALDSRIELLKVRLEDMTVRAPFDGRVVNRQAESGEWTIAGREILTMISGGPLEAWLEVPERYSNDVLHDPGQVRVTIGATGEEIAAASSRLMPQVDPRVRTIVLIATVDPGERFLAPGMSVSADIPTGEKAMRMTVSKDALQQGPSGAFLYKAQKGLQDQAFAMPVQVKVLFNLKDRVAIESEDLAEGDPVIVEGNERLRAMAPVRLLPPVNGHTQAPGK